MLHQRASIEGLDAALKYGLTRIVSAVDDEMKSATDGMKADLRSQTEEALGIRVANAWRGKFYANDGDPKGPAAFVWSKAPRIVDFFSSSKVVTPLGEAFAIPTENVPRGPRGRRLSPIEVEARFNAELQPVRLKSGRIGLFIDVIAARGGRGFRAATKGRRGQGRKVQKLLMFVLLRGPLRSRQLIDLDAIAAKWGASVTGNIERRLGVDS